MDSARRHDWLPPSWLALIEAVHAQRCATAGAWLAQLQATRDGFAALPMNEALSGAQPAPVTWDPA